MNTSKANGRIVLASTLAFTVLFAVWVDLRHRRSGFQKEIPSYRLSVFYPDFDSILVGSLRVCRRACWPTASAESA